MPSSTVNFSLNGNSFNDYPSFSSMAHYVMLPGRSFNSSFCNFPLSSIGNGLQFLLLLLFRVCRWISKGNKSFFIRARWAKSFRHHLESYHQVILISCVLFIYLKLSLHYCYYIILSYVYLTITKVWYIICITFIFKLILINNFNTKNTYFILK